MRRGITVAILAAFDSAVMWSAGYPALGGMMGAVCVCGIFIAILSAASSRHAGGTSHE